MLVAAGLWLGLAALADVVLALFEGRGALLDALAEAGLVGGVALQEKEGKVSEGCGCAGLGKVSVLL